MRRRAGHAAGGAGETVCSALARTFVDTGSCVALFNNDVAVKDQCADVPEELVVGLRLNGASPRPVHARAGPSCCSEINSS